MKMLEKIYKWMKAGTAVLLAILLVTTVMEFTVPMLAGGLLCKLAGLSLGGTLMMYAFKTMGFMNCCDK